MSDFMSIGQMENFIFPLWNQAYAPCNGKSISQVVFEHLFHAFIHKQPTNSLKYSLLSSPTHPSPRPVEGWIPKVSLYPLPLL